MSWRGSEGRDGGRNGSVAGKVRQIENEARPLVDIRTLKGLEEGIAGFHQATHHTTYVPRQ